MEVCRIRTLPRQNIEKCNVHRHERCKAHRDAAKAAGWPAASQPAASQAQEDSDGEDDAPTIGQIMEFWERTQNGCSNSMPVEGFSSGVKRNRKLEWCIAETLRARFRTFVETSAAVSASLIQDGRGKHLMVRASACNDKLQTALSNIGVIATQGGATNLCVATLTALQEFCTKGLARPGDPHPDVPSPQVDKQLLAKLCAAVRWWFTDAAYDEFAAGELLVTRPDANRLFSNLRVIGRERAHASRRILTRPQTAEPFLTEVADHFIWNYDSIASLIQHNPTVGDVWRDSARSDPAASQITTLRFRRHRFDSQAEPLTRLLLGMDAALQTLSAVSHARKTEPVGKACVSILKWMTDEAVLQAAMVADASHQVLMLVRSNDVDQPDPASMAEFVSSFLLEGARLWLEGHCWGFGCTATMLRYLKTSRTYLIAGGQEGICKIGGGVDDMCKKRCLDRMVCWFRLAIDVCQAEWPYHDVVNALQVFSVVGSASSAGSQALQSQSLVRLADCFGCSPIELEAQMQ